MKTMNWVASQVLGQVRERIKEIKPEEDGVQDTYYQYVPDYRAGWNDAMKAVHIALGVSDD